MKQTQGLRKLDFRSAFRVNCLRSSKCPRRQLESVCVWASFMGLTSFFMRVTSKKKKVLEQF